MIYVNGVEVSMQDRYQKDKKEVVFVIHESMYSQRKIKENDSVREITIPPGSLSLPAAYTASLIDGIEKQIRYVTSTRNKGLGTSNEVVYLPNEVEIIAGRIIVPASKPDLIWWLRNHPNNETNPLYEKGDVARPANIWFKEKNIKLEKEASYASIEAETNTKYKIFNLKKADVKDIFESLDFADKFEDVGEKGAKEILIHHAAKVGFDKFDDYMKGHEMIFNNIINKAIEYNIIELKETQSTRIWIWVGAQQFCTVPKGADAREHLYITIMKKDSSGLLSKIKEKVEEYESKQ